MQEQMQKVDGKMQFMLWKLQEDQTPFEYSASGLELNAYRTEAFARVIAHNKSLLSMDFARQGIQDLDGTKLADILYTNKTLRKLELEGNLLGPKTASAFGEVLKRNKSLKYLDLESNQLTLDGQDMSGVAALMDFLDHNTTLLSLNLANNQID
jgi:Ran GTPase-activating protein (RanGAP) involved in mRNA processing and transport